LDRRGEPREAEDDSGGGTEHLRAVQPDEETFANALLWKNLLLRTCTTLLWEGDRDGVPVTVRGGEPIPLE
jgi:hypothetical protein